MKILNHAVCVLALSPSIAQSKNLRQEKRTKPKHDFRSVHQHDRQHEASNESPFVAVASLAAIEHAAIKNGAFVITKIDSTTAEISNVRDYEEKNDGQLVQLTSCFFRGKEDRKSMSDYTASCFLIDKVERDYTCNIYLGTSPNIAPNVETAQAAIDRFCSPNEDLGNCDYYPTSCIGSPEDISNATCTQDNYTCVATPIECYPKNEFYCGHGFVGSNPLSCAHSVNCTGSDGEANQTFCAELHMSCFDTCGPTY